MFGSWVGEIVLRKGVWFRAGMEFGILGLGLGSGWVGYMA